MLNNKLLLVEHAEQSPFFLQENGMVSRMRNYFFKPNLCRKDELKGLINVGENLILPDFQGKNADKALFHEFFKVYPMYHIPHAENGYVRLIENNL